MRLLLLGTLSATLLALLLYGGTLIATRRPGDSLRPIDAPDQPPEAPPPPRPLRSVRALPSLDADRCTPRPGWACWRGRLQLPASVRATWAEKRAAQSTGEQTEDAVGDPIAAEPPEELPPEAPFDESFSISVSPVDDGTDDDAVIAEAVVSLHADGTFEIEVQPGRYNLEATSEDNLLIGGRDDLRAVAGAAEDGVDIVLGPAVGLSGRVLDQDDVPVGVTLTLMRTGEGSTTLADEDDGKIAFTGLRPGTYHLRAETHDGHVTDGTYVVPQSDVVIRVPRAPAGLLLFPRQPDGRCPTRYYRLIPRTDASGGVPSPTTGGQLDGTIRSEIRNARVIQCQAVVEDVPPGSAWDVMVRERNSPVMTQVHFGSGWPLAPICVQGTCADGDAVLEPWLMDLNGDHVDYPVTVTEASDPDGTSVGWSGTGPYVYGLHANRTVTVQVDTDAGPVTQQVWLQPGVNRAVIRLPVRSDSTTDVVGEGIVN